MLRSQLHLHYWWNTRSDDRKLIGNLDNRSFNRSEGFEVINLIIKTFSALVAEEIYKVISPSH